MTPSLAPLAPIAESDLQAKLAAMPQSELRRLLMALPLPEDERLDSGSLADEVVALAAQAIVAQAPLRAEAGA